MSKKRREIVQTSTGEMVRITDFLKTPEERKELEELQAWLRESEHLIKFPEEKVTQGSRKMKQVLEDARRDSQFQKGIEQFSKKRAAYQPKDLKDLYLIYMLYLSALASFRKTFIIKDPYYKLKKSLCKKYGIDSQLFDALHGSYMQSGLEGWDFDDATSGDVCIIEEQSQRDAPLDIHTYHLDIVDDIDSLVYPIKIRLHRFASKRDILDFIEKKWDEISPYLEKKRTRIRNLKRDVVDYIWKHRNESAKKIRELLNEKYPEVRLAYYEITKIISEEKKRRRIKK